MEQEKHYRIDELSELTGIVERNIRFYIQKGLLDKPEGERRGAYYTNIHLEQLLIIKQLRDEEGLSLEKIKQSLHRASSEDASLIVDRSGTQRIWQIIIIGEGLTLNNCPELSGLKQEQLESLYQVVQKELEHIERKKEK